MKSIKQHITEEQWISMIDENPSGLTELSIFILQTYGEMTDQYINIGQMIEFLGDDWYEYIVEIERDRVAKKLNDDDFALDPCESYIPYNEYLCNILWEAVKNKLRK